MKEKTENENADGLAAIPVHNAANLKGWQPELLVHGQKSGQPLPENAVREAQGREFRLMADHGTYDIAARGVARGKLGRAKRLDGWGKSWMRSRLVAQQFNCSKRDDVTQGTPPQGVIVWTQGWSRGAVSGIVGLQCRLLPCAA